MLQSQQIIKNWARFLDIIENQVSSDRSRILLDFYTKNQERISMAPSSDRDWKNSAFPGGYIDHVLRVYDIALEANKSWVNSGGICTFSTQELTFVALHHDLGKIGTETEDYYIPNDSDWHIKNMGMVYKFNEHVPAMKLSERSLFLLQSLGINLTYEEYMAIKLCDGLYDSSNGFYFHSGQKETKLKSYLPFLLHHSSVQSSHIEFQRWSNGTIAENFVKSITENPLPKDFNSENSEELKIKPASKSYKTQRISSLDSVKNNNQISSKTLDIINNMFND
jgi:hypothetical protein